MANIVRFAGGLHRVAGHQLFSRPVALSSILMPRKTIVLSATSHKRLYGPEEEHEKKDEVHHWVNERYAAVALLPLIPAALAYPNFILDTLLTSAMVLHTHWRLSGVAQDYIHGEILPRIARPLVYVLTICAFGSICYFNYTDIGFANAARLLYTQI